MVQTQPWKWDLVGLTWAEAEQVLAERGQICATTVISPPNRPEGVEPLRVVAERRNSEGLRLILAYRDYRRPLSDQI